MNFIEEIITRDLESGRVKSIKTRIPPEPNGYLHIGHAKSVYINYYMTAKAFGGTCNLRFDDTNPEKEDTEYVNAIIQDVKWLGFEGDIFYSSDYFQQKYDCAVSLIKKGLAYVDDTPSDKMSEMRGTLTKAGVNSPCRERSIEDNLRLFEEMKAGKYADGTLVLRAKIDMSSPNINMRDPVIYKILHAHHYRQGTAWCIYPLYDFDHPLQDAIEGITHSLCSIEFENHRPLYDWFMTNLSEFFPNPPIQREFARLNIERTIMSKRYLKKLVDEGAVTGWDDPRMPTLCGMRRRGYTPSAILRFVSEAGISKEYSEVSPAQMEATLRDELNQSTDRVMAVINPIKLVITNRPNGWSEKVQIENNPNEEARGTREVTISKELYIEQDDFSVDPPPKYKRLTVGANIRLKGAYVVKCTGYEGEGSSLTALCEIIEGSMSGSGSDVKAKGVIHWVDANNAADMEIRLYDYLLLPFAGEEDFASRMNPDSLKIMQGKGEKILKSAEKGSRYQFIRNGYFIRDIKSDCNELVFNRIVGLKDTYNR